jgi:hypothetical protein
LDDARPKIFDGQDSQKVLPLLFCPYELCKIFLQESSMSAEWSTFGKLQKLLRETDLLPIQFVALCNVFGIQVSNALISRAIKAGQFNNHETDEMLRPLVLKLEDVVERAAPFTISFENAESTKLILDVIDLGVDIQVGTAITIASREVPHAD